MNTVEYFSQFRGYICTAREDGSIPLNARAVCKVEGVDDEKRLALLIAQANAFATIYPAFNKVREYADKENLKAAFNAFSTAMSRMPPL